MGSFREEDVQRAAARAGLPVDAMRRALVSQGNTVEAPASPAQAQITDALVEAAEPPGVFERMDQLTGATPQVTSPLGTTTEAVADPRLEAFRRIQATPAEVVDPDAAASREASGVPAAQPARGIDPFQQARAQFQTRGPRVPGLAAFGANDASGLVSARGADLDGAESAVQAAQVDADFATGVASEIQRERGDVAADAARIAGAAKADQAQFNEEQGREVLARQEQRQKAIGALQADLSAANEELAGVKIGDRRTPAQKAKGFLATIISGLGQALSAGAGINAPNMALDMIQRDIQRDMDAQLEMLRNKRLSFQAKQSELGIMRQRFQDEDAAQKMFLAHKQEQYQRAFEAESAGTSSADAKLVAEQAAAMMEAEVAQNREQAARSLLPQYLSRSDRAEETDVSFKRQARSARSQAAARAARSSGLSAGVALPPGFKVSDPRRFQTVKPADREKGIAGINKVRELVGTLRKLDALEGKSSVRARNPLSEVNAEVEGLQAQALIQVKEAGEMGALDQGMLTVAGRLLGDAASMGSFVSGSDRAKRSAMIGSMVNTVRLEGQRLGVRVDMKDRPKRKGAAK